MRCRPKSRPSSQWEGGHRAQVRWTSRFRLHGVGVAVVTNPNWSLFRPNSRREVELRVRSRLTSRPRLHGVGVVLVEVHTKGWQQ
jgi:hypothetical protein